MTTLLLRYAERLNEMQIKNWSKPLEKRYLIWIDVAYMEIRYLI